MQMIKGLKKKYGKSVILLIYQFETVRTNLLLMTRLVWLRLLSSCRPLSWLHTMLFTKSFRREMHAVLTGRCAHLSSLRDGSGLVFTLRRNVHRIEKGLLMRPRREVFALSYIQETVDVYRTACSSLNVANSMSETLQWASDVLQQYFEKVKPHPIVVRARESFVARGPEGVIASKIPQPQYLAVQGAMPDVEMFKALCAHRKSVRWFLGKPVPKELLDRAFEIAGMAPSACNRQPYRFIVVDVPGAVTEIGNIPAGTAGYARQVPVYVVVLGNLSAYFDSRDRHVIYVDGALAAMNFMLALETLGLSSCPINWPDTEDRERSMETFLRLSPWERPVLVIGVGYADPEGMVAYSQRKSLDEIREYLVLEHNDENCMDCC